MSPSPSLPSPKKKGYTLSLYNIIESSGYPLLSSLILHLFSCFYISELNKLFVNLLAEEGVIDVVAVLVVGEHGVRDLALSDAAENADDLPGSLCVA